MTFRMRGHEEASGTKYVPKEMFEQWLQKDPIKNYEQWLQDEMILSADDIVSIKGETKNYIETELQSGFVSEKIIPDTEEEVDDPGKDHCHEEGT